MGERNVKIYVNNLNNPRMGPYMSPCFKWDSQIQHTLPEYYGISKTHGSGYINFTLSVIQSNASIFYGVTILKLCSHELPIKSGFLECLYWKMHYAPHWSAWSRWNGLGEGHKCYHGEKIKMYGPKQIWRENKSCRLRDGMVNCWYLSMSPLVGPEYFSMSPYSWDKAAPFFLINSKQYLSVHGKIAEIIRCEQCPWSKRAVLQTAC